MNDIVVRKAKLESERLPYIITSIISMSVVIGTLSLALFSFHDGVLFIPVGFGLLTCKLVHNRIVNV